MQTCDPLEARRWFKWRDPLNWAGVIVGYCILLVILQPFFPTLLIDFVLMGVAFFVLFFVLPKRTIGIICPHCVQYLATNTPWICGFKKCRNDHIDDYPFIHRCQHCGAKPMAYKCHHCGKLIYFSKDKQEENYATRVNVAVDSMPGEQVPHEEQISQRQRDIELAELEVKKAGIDSELNSLKERLNPTKPKSDAESLRSKFLKGRELEDEVHRIEAEIDREFEKGSPEWERQHARLKAIVLEML